MMMYDFHGQWEETSLVNHHSSLHSDDNLNVVSSWLKSCENVMTYIYCKLSVVNLSVAKIQRVIDFFIRITYLYNTTLNGSRNVFFQLIISDIFLIFAPKIDCGAR